MIDKKKKKLNEDAGWLTVETDINIKRNNLVWLLFGIPRRKPKSDDDYRSR